MRGLLNKSMADSMGLTEAVAALQEQLEAAQVRGMWV
jgi:hypothetical protein